MTPGSLNPIAVGEGRGGKRVREGCSWSIQNARERGGGLDCDRDGEGRRQRPEMKGEDARGATMVISRGGAVERERGGGIGETTTGWKKVRIRV